MRHGRVHGDGLPGGFAARHRREGGDHHGLHLHPLRRQGRAVSRAGGFNHRRADSVDAGGE